MRKRINDLVQVLQGGLSFFSHWWGEWVHTVLTEVGDDLMVVAREDGITIYDGYAQEFELLPGGGSRQHCWDRTLTAAGYRRVSRWRDNVAFARQVRDDRGLQQ